MSTKLTEIVNEEHLDNDNRIVLSTKDTEIVKITCLPKRRSTNYIQMKEKQL